MAYKQYPDAHAFLAPVTGDDDNVESSLFCFGRRQSAAVA